jgi:hypothetical protein
VSSAWPPPPPPPAAAAASSPNATDASSNAAAKAKPLVAVARSILVIIWHLLADPTVRYHDLGPDHHDKRVNTDRKLNNLVRQLEALGHTVTLKRQHLTDPLSSGPALAGPATPPAQNPTWTG